MVDRPVLAAVPPYWVTSSGLPSSFRWSCLSVMVSSVLVKIQVLDLSSPAKNGIRILFSSQLFTCITNFLPVKPSSTLPPAIISPSKDCPQNDFSFDQKSSDSD